MTGAIAILSVVCGILAGAFASQALRPEKNPNAPILGAVLVAALVCLTVVAWHG